MAEEQLTTAHYGYRSFAKVFFFFGQMLNFIQFLLLFYFRKGIIYFRKISNQNMLKCLALEGSMLQFGKCTR